MKRSVVLALVLFTTLCPTAYAQFMGYSGESDPDFDKKELNDERVSPIETEQLKLELAVARELQFWPIWMLHTNVFPWVQERVLRHRIAVTNVRVTACANVVLGSHPDCKNNEWLLEETKRIESISRWVKLDTKVSEWSTSIVKRHSNARIKRACDSGNYAETSMICRLNSWP